MIDPVTVLNSSNTNIPGVALGTLVPDGSGGYQLSVSMEWLHGVIHYVLQPVLLMLVVILIIVMSNILLKVVFR